MQGDPMDEFAQREMDDAIVDALGDTPRAAELSRMKDILIRHRDVLQRELDKEERSDEKQKLVSRLNELDQQIQVLGEEATINKFVEDAIHFSHEMRKMQN
ncbi:MAG: hypothetical protein ABI210_13425 [Abditibacteriaceae bacterium]